MAGILQRQPAVAGKFYPSKPERLREVVQQYMDASAVEAAPERVTAVVAPHAGYMYSGPTAGYAYARLRGKRPGRIILLGCSHQFHIPTAAVYVRGSFATPLADFPVDEAFAETVAQRFGARFNEPHMFEHSLEVQLPFLAVAVGEVPVVPVLFGAPADEWHAEVGQGLAEMAGESDLVVASTDLSHYNAETRANDLDHATIDAVLAQDWRRLALGSAREEYSLCGAAAVVATMAYALRRGASAWSLLDYRTSARAGGDYERVVGYAALSMELPS